MWWFILQGILEGNYLKKILILDRKLARLALGEIAVISIYQIQERLKRDWSIGWKKSEKKNVKKVLKYFAKRHLFYVITVISCKSLAVEVSCEKSLNFVF